MVNSKPTFRLSLLNSHKWSITHEALSIITFKKGTFIDLYWSSQGIIYKTKQRSVAEDHPPEAVSGNTHDWQSFIASVIMTSEINYCIMICLMRYPWLVHLVDQKTLTWCPRQFLPWCFPVPWVTTGQSEWFLSGAFDYNDVTCPYETASLTLHMYCIWTGRLVCMISHIQNCLCFSRWCRPLI